MRRPVLSVLGGILVLAAAGFLVALLPWVLRVGTLRPSASAGRP